jgi:hypothetical protein
MKWDHPALAKYPHRSYHAVRAFLTSDSPLMLQWGRLLLWIIFLIPLWYIKHLHSAEDKQDGVILIAMGSIFVVAFLIMLWENRVRTLRNLGLMTVFLGLGLLFILSGLPYFGYLKDRTETQLDVVRTLYIAGGFAFVYGAFNAIRDWEFNRYHVILFLCNLSLIAVLLYFAFTTG